MRIFRWLLVLLCIAGLVASIAALVGCIPIGGGPGSPDAPLPPRTGAEFGESLGTAADHFIRGEYVAAGLSAVFGIVVAVGRYFFRRGAVAEIDKQQKIEEKIKEVVNGSASSTG